MIWDFIPQLLIVIGVGGILILVVRKSGTLTDEYVTQSLEQSAVFAWWKRMYDEKVKPNINSRKLEERFLLFVEKGLHIVRILNLKIENWASVKLESIKAMRSKPEFDAQYWFSVHRLLLEKKIEELFGNIPVQDIIDPIKEEMSLKRKRKHRESLDRWLNLARFYLAQNHLPEARRVLIICWQRNPSDERVLTLLDSLIVKTEELKNAPSGEIAVRAEEAAEKDVAQGVVTEVSETPSLPNIPTGQETEHEQTKQEVSAEPDEPESGNEEKI